MVNRREVKFIRPIICADCGGQGKAVIELAMTVEEDWTIDESSMAITGRHKNCQKILTAGALEGVLGEPDVSGITEGGSVHKHWTNDPEKLKEYEQELIAQEEASWEEDEEEENEE